MPIAFAAIIVAALWPLKRWLGRYMPSWLAYTLTLVADRDPRRLRWLCTCRFGQVIGAMSSQWAGWRRATRGSPPGRPTRRADRRNDQPPAHSGDVADAGERILCLRHLCRRYIGIVVMLGLPEVPRLLASTVRDV